MDSIPCRKQRQCKHLSPGVEIRPDEAGDHDPVLDRVLEGLHVGVVNHLVVPVPEHPRQGVTWAAQ